MVTHVNIENGAKQRLETASAILVQAPVTPSGTEAYLQFLLETIPAPPAETNAVVATYTKSADEWLADWRAQAGDLPASGAIIDVGGMMRSATAQSGDSRLTFGPFSVMTADPADPVGLVTEMSDHLDRAVDSGAEPVVSVETLTAFIEYTDLETAFRYLHLFTHRLRAAEATGYFYIDPKVHGEETIDTLRGLFDAVVECSLDDDDEWRAQLQGAHFGGTRTESNTSASPPVHDDDPTSSVREKLPSLVAHASTSPSPDQSSDASSDVAETGETPSAQPAPPLSPEQIRTGSRIGDEEFLDKEDRINQLLRQHSGRMKQRAITENISWSASTVSRVLSTMEDAEQIQRVKTGREKIVFLDGHEPDVVPSSDSWPPEQS